MILVGVIVHGIAGDDVGEGVVLGHAVFVTLVQDAATDLVEDGALGLLHKIGFGNAQFAVLDSINRGIQVVTLAVLRTLLVTGRSVGQRLPHNLLDTQRPVGIHVVIAQAGLGGAVSAPLSLMVLMG